MGGWQAPFVGAGSSLHSGEGGPKPIPLEAHLTAAGRLFSCLFDQPLRVQDLADANWFGKALNWTLDLSELHVSGSEVRAFNRPGVPTTPGNRCNYLATPPDVQSLQAAEADPFFGFPLQVHG
jgi:hypothetical protein